MKNILRVSIILLSAIGFWGVSKISYIHFIAEESCPMLGVIPACYVIFFAYGTMVLSVLFNIPNMKKIFTIAWLPVIILALMGTFGELTHTVRCPHTDSGLPQCYISAGLSGFIGLLAFWYFKLVKND